MPVTVLIGGGVGLHPATETPASVLLWWVKGTGGVSITHAERTEKPLSQQDSLFKEGQ